MFRKDGGSGSWPVIGGILCKSRGGLDGGSGIGWSFGIHLCPAGCPADERDPLVVDNGMDDPLLDFGVPHVAEAWPGLLFFPILFLSGH